MQNASRQYSLEFPLEKDAMYADLHPYKVGSLLLLQKVGETFVVSDAF